MCVKLSSVFDREMKAYYFTQVLKQVINVKTMYPYYILETWTGIYRSIFSKRVDQKRNGRRSTLLIIIM